VSKQYIPDAVLPPYVWCITVLEYCSSSVSYYICYRFPFYVGLSPLPENGFLKYYTETCRIPQAVK